MTSRVDWDPVKWGLTWWRATFGFCFQRFCWFFGYL